MLRWTAYGTIDVRQVAGLLIWDYRVPVARRYEIACNFCFQEDVERIWNEMKPEEFHQKNLREIKKHRRGLVYYWSCFAKGELRHFLDYPLVDLGLSPTENVFHIIRNNISSFNCNEISLEYFWNKMTEVEKRRQIERLKEEESSSDAMLDLYCLDKHETFCYLLSLMDPDDQTNILKRSPDQFLRIFLNRPWQHLFFPVLRLVEGCETFTESLPSFLGQISLDQCDEAMRRRIVDHLRHLFSEYFYNKPQVGRRFRSKLREGQREYVLEIMRDATEAHKIAFLMDILKSDEVFGKIIGCAYVPLLKGLVEAWVSLDGWPDLKVKLEGVYQRLYGFLPDSTVMRLPESTNLREWIDSLDDHFHNLARSLLYSVR